MARPHEVVLIACLLVAQCATAGVYYVSSSGADGNPGTSPEAAWRTLDRVNRADLAPGDTVRLRCGDTWRGQLRPRSGDASGVITYTSFGEGPKPVLLGSMDLSAPDAWLPAGDKLWETHPPRAYGESLLGTPGSPASPVAWSFYQEHGAKASMTYDAATAACRVHCDSPGATGSDIQLSAMPFPVRTDTPLQLRFRARCTKPFDLPGAALMKAGPPWTSYSHGDGGPSTRIGTEWTEVTRTYGVSTDADDGRLTLIMGGAIPEGADLFIADFTLRPCDLSRSPLVDVGNLILNDEAECGVKVFNEAECDGPGKYWYDEGRSVLRMWCDGNPGERYTRIEAALRQHIIDETNTSFVTYEGLCLKYGAAHGIGGGSTHHITARNCDIGYIGGGDQMGGESTVRFGNGIEFWGAAHDNLVEGCRLWQIYDAALTNQNLGSVVEQRDITYRHNVIWDSEYSFEYWNRPKESVTRNVVFEHNTCVRAGYGWGHDQRPDPSGRHLCFYGSDAQASGIIIRDNVFFEAREHAFSAQWWTRQQLPSLVMDHNLWYQREGQMVAYAHARYTMEQFAAYQAELGLDAGSLVGDPLFRDAAAADFRLAPGSPCIGKGHDGSDIGA
jgi:hypothetical protein